eukprot:c5515_g1_i1.p1 GENE.c5515_g1_i1~~c5515_g1_i1.p1  ORF type:complete len:461 (-),score=149.21 c5515_g1_i1:530-1912(-)
MGATKADHTHTGKGKKHTLAMLSSRRFIFPIASRAVVSRGLFCLSAQPDIVLRTSVAVRVNTTFRPQANVFARQMSELAVSVPTMGESVKDGSIGAFSKKVGDYVRANEEIVQIETDKITHSLTAPQGGKITKINFEQGSTVEVGQVVFVIDTSAAAPEGAPAAAAPSPSQPKPQAQEPTPAPSSQPKPAAQAAAAQPPKPSPAQPAPKPQPAQQQTSSVSHVLVPGTREVKKVPMSRMRLKIAQRLKDAQNSTAMLTTFNEIDMTNATAMRADLKDEFATRHGLKLGFMSFFVKASVAALRAQPTVNAYIEGNEIVYNDFVDISVAVATPAGLVVPVLRNCETMSLADVEKEIASLGERARNGQLTLADMSGGTFTISNGGVFGSMFGTPIINPPQSAILGMHAIKDRVVAVNGKIEIRPIMYIALTYDHRLIDGREAATCLKTIKEMVEDPRRLLLDL